VLGRKKGLSVPEVLHSVTTVSRALHLFASLFSLGAKSDNVRSGAEQMAGEYAIADNL
jgi:hypothetical protein